MRKPQRYTFTTFDPALGEAGFRPFLPFTLNIRNNLLVVTVEVSNRTIESDYNKKFMEGYQFAKQELVPQYEARLRDKDKDINSKDQQINALILKGGSTQLIQNAYGVAVNVQGSQKICLPTPDTIQSNYNENEE